MINRTKYAVLTVLAFAVSVIPPFVATLMQFPVWIHNSAEATVSGIAAVLIFLCCVPFWKAIVQYFKSPSAPVMWICICVFMYVMKSIAAEMFMVSLIGAFSNLVGCLFFKLRKRYDDKGGV